MKVSKIILATLFFSFSSFIPTDIAEEAYYAIAQNSVNEDRKTETERLLNLCREHLANNQFESALKSCQESINAHQEIGDRSGEVKSTVNLGIVYQSLNQNEKAILLLQSSLEKVRQIGNKKIEAILLFYLGRAFATLGKSQQAVDYYQSSLIISKDIGELSLEANISTSLGLVYSFLGQYNQQIKYFHNALDIFKKIGISSGELYALDQLGFAYHSLGKYQQAINYHQHSLAIAKDLKNRLQEAKSLASLGDVYLSLEQHQQAIEYSRRSLVIARDIGDRLEEANALSVMGVTYFSLEKYQQGIDYLQQSLAIKKEIGDRLGEAKTLRVLGNAYGAIGKNESSIDYSRRALDIFKEIGKRHDEAVALNDLAIGYSELGQHQLGINYLKQSIAIYQDIEDRYGKSRALGSLAYIYISLGEFQKAIDYFQESLAISKDAGYSFLAGISLNGLGVAYRSLGEFQKAIDYFQESLAISKDVDDKLSEAGNISDLGLTLIKLEQFTEAESQLIAGIKVFESLRKDLNDSNKISILYTQLRAYDYLQQALIAQNKIETALEIAERGSAIALVDLLSSRLDAGASEVTEYASQSASYFLKVEQIRQIASRQNSTLVQYSQIGNNSFFIWVIKPTGEIEFRQVSLNNLNLVQTNKLNLENSSSVSITHDSKHESSIIIEAVAKTRSSLDLNKDRAGVEVFGLSKADPRESLRSWHQLLIEPIADLLPTNPNERVVFIPKGILFLVPFPALQDESGQYLIEKHTILTSPSIQVLDLTRKQKEKLASSRSLNSDTSPMLIVGNPTMPSLPSLPDEPTRQLPSLPDAEREAIEIAKFFDTEAITGDEATETVIAQKISNARLIHFATHGLLEYGIPEDSLVRDVPGAIAFAPSAQDDGLLTSSEILDLDLNAELVVLSACDTGRGKITGDGVIGLSRSLISAGVPSVIVSLWSVPDTPTADLMTEFYKNLEENPDKAQALRQAMLSTMKNYPNPVDWAAFTLIGEAE